METLGYWQQIDKALELIETGDPTTFDDVRTALDLWGDPDRVGTHTADATFFAGSGGDGRLLDALEEAGWRTVWIHEWFHFCIQHPRTHETLTYVEGDVYRGDRRAL